MNPDVPQKNLESAIKLYDELQQVTKTAGKEAEFLQLSLKLKIKKEVLDSVNNDLKTLYNQVVDQTQSNNIKDSTPTSSSTGDNSDSKFTSTIWNGKTYKKASRIADRQEHKLEKIDDYIKRKLDIDGVDGLVAAVNQLNQEVRSQYPELFLKKFDTGIDERKAQESAKLTQDASVQNATNEITKTVKAGASEETVMWVINKKVDDFAKKTLIDKAWRSQGAVDVGKFIWWLYLAFKAIGFANDQFPSGIEWLILKAGAAYAAYAGYDKYKDKILEWIKSITGVDTDKNQNKPADELSHRKLESKSFKDGETLFKWILARFINTSSDKLSKYATATNFNLGQFIADYSGQKVDLWKTYDPTVPLVSQKDLHSDMNFLGDKEYDHFAMLRGQIKAWNGKFYEDSINTYIKWLGLSAIPATVQWFNEAFTNYENIQKTRYNIIKRAGYELKIENDESGKPKDVRSSVDAELQKRKADWSKDPNLVLDDSVAKVLVDQWYIIKWKETKESVLWNIQERKKQWLGWLDSVNEQREFVEEFDKSSQELKKLSTPDWLPNHPNLDYDDSWMDITKNKTWNTGSKILYYENYWIRVPFKIWGLNEIMIQGTDVHGTIKDIFYQMDTWAFAIATLHYSSKDQAATAAGSKKIFTHGEWWLRYVGWGNGIQETVMNLIGQWALSKRFALASKNGADGWVFADKLTALKDREKPGMRGWTIKDWVTQGWTIIPVRSMWSQGGNLPPHYLARHWNGQKITINPAAIDQVVQTNKPEYDDDNWSVVATNWITKHWKELWNVTTAFTKVTLQIVWKALKAWYKEVGNNLIWPDWAISLIWDVLIETWYEWIKITNKVVSKWIHDVSHNEFLWKDLDLTAHRVTNLTIGTLEWVLKGSGWLINKVLASNDFKKLLNTWWATAEKIADIVTSTATHIFWDSKEEMGTMGWLRTWWAMLLWWWLKNGMNVPSWK